MPLTAVRGENYYWESKGVGEPLLALHGFTGSRLSWAVVAQDLAKSRQMVAVDLLGHGRSSAPPDPQRFRMQEAAGDLAALIGQWKFGWVDLLGYSMGGRLALYFTLTYPHLVRKLILESASPGLETTTERAQRRRSDEELAKKIMERDIPDFVDYWQDIPLFQSQKRLPLVTRRSLREQRLANKTQGLANSLRGMGTGSQPLLWARLPEVQQDTLVISGSLDEKFSTVARQMAAKIAHAHRVEIGDAGHNVHLEKPVEFGQAVAGFLAGQDRSAGEQNGNPS